MDQSSHATRGARPQLVLLRVAIPMRPLLHARSRAVSVASLSRLLASLFFWHHRSRLRGRFTPATSPGSKSTADTHHWGRQDEDGFSSVGEKRRRGGRGVEDFFGQTPRRTAHPFAPMTVSCTPARARSGVVVPSRI